MYSVSFPNKHHPSTLILNLINKSLRLRSKAKNWTVGNELVYKQNHKQNHITRRNTMFLHEWTLLATKSEI